MRKILSGFWVLVLGFGEEVSAGIVHVPGDHSTLQAAVNAASPGDIVLVAAGTYRGAGNHDIDFGGKGLTVRGEAGARSTVIDCEGQGRAFRFPPDEPAGALLGGPEPPAPFRACGPDPTGDALTCQAHSACPS